MNVRLLEASELEPAVAVLCSAFEGDSLLAWACGERAPSATPAAFRMTTKVLLAARSVYGAVEGGQLVGVALVQRPDVKLSIRAGLTSGLLSFPFQAGLRGARRLVRTFGETEEFKRGLMREKPYYYLDTIGVLLERTGRGLGTAFIQQVLEDLRVRAPHPSLLLTHNPRNAGFYERLGFETIGRCAIERSPITFSAMLRPASV